MEEDSKITKPRFCLFTSNEQAFVAGENGWNIFNVTSQQPYYEMQTDKIEDIAMNNEIMAVATYDATKYHLYIGPKSKDGIHPEWNLASSSPINPIVASNHAIISYHEDEIELYDYRDKDNISFTVPYDTKVTRLAHIPLLISSHPTKLEFIYPSSKKTLSIVQPYHDTFTKMKLKTNFLQCDGGQYNPNGTMLALKANFWQYFIYNLEHNDSHAYQIGTNQVFISSAFHPSLYTLFLLSADNIIEGWDYLRRILLFTTYPLAHTSHNGMNHCTYSKRLACSPDGKKLLVALEDEWKIIDIPQKDDLFSSVDIAEFFQLNLTEFYKVKTLAPIRGGVNLSKEAVVPTKNKRVTAVYLEK
jgi:WD40 repeat protein